MLIQNKKNGFEKNEEVNEDVFSWCSCQNFEVYENWLLCCKLQFLGIIQVTE